MNNVVKLTREDSVKDHIEYFLNSLESENTKARYSIDIERFLKWKFKNIPIEHLTYNDINSIQYIDMKKFQNYLRKKYANSTVNVGINAVMSFLRELKKIRDSEGNKIYTLDVDELQVKRLKENKEEYGYVEWEEMDEWIEYLLNLPEKQNPKRKAAFIQIARMTGMRKEALAEMKYKDLKKINGVWTITHYIKGKKHVIPIQDKDAEMLLDLKETNDPNEKILKLSTKTFERTLQQIREHFNIPPERNIVLHSIRGEAGYEAYLSSGKDILAAQQLLGHESINTTFSYINKRESLTTHPSLYMNRDFNDTSKLEKLTSEDWINIFSKLSRSAKYEIMNIIEKEGYSHE